MSPAPPEPAPPVRRALLAFEGGGAKGLVHLGALHAIEESGRFEIAGVAGTSAGAMIAALVAAGYTAEELFALAGPPPAEQRGAAPHAGFRTVLDTLGIADATQVFGPASWHRLEGRRRLFAWGLRGAAAALAGGLLMAAVALLLFGAWGCYAGLLAVLAGTGWLAASLLWGGADLAGVRDIFDAALRRKCPAAQAANRRVTFADLPHLRICAANLTLRRLEVFSAQTSPEIAVADAVCASICFPFAFRPWPILRDGNRGTELHLDGGLISNLPAWCLDEERRLDTDAITLAIAIRDTGQHRRPTRRDWLGAMLRTTIFGGEVLSTRGAGPIEVLRLDTQVELLAFDIDKEAALREVREQRRATAALLATRVLGFPDRLRDATRSLRAAASAWERSVSIGLGIEAPPADSIRVALALPEDHLTGGVVLREGKAAVRSLTLRFGAGFEGWADEGLVLPLAGTTIGEAWTRQEAAFRFLDTPDSAFRGPGNQHRAQRMRPNLAWVLGVPVAIPFPAPETEASGPAILDAVVVVDGLTQVPPERAARAAFVAALETLISKEIFPTFRTSQPGEQP